ncbi:N-acetylglucosamine-6-phosphate deacetylase [Anoxybacter fermentans]|uniref:N-acetylglucosamine-6-phosphate deacetylase n=1 Tax=Anoxybacter fermentans TaxID=1323375 RepID=A0A3Q9HP04_9FIRM|nr:N-acetylglucosamine-6-phosphate deacetylase [Anoxybacter fermentans]AZR72256.1 N-acetylglucosamine-6-phosphate deacetylase [Anoxybacter fermentans]
MTIYLINGKIVLRQGILADHVLVIRDGKIAEMLLTDEVNDLILKDHQVIDLKGGYICPGWIDIHCHGAVGVDVMDGDIKGLMKIARFKASQGVTGFVPTGITASFDQIERAVEVVAKATEINEDGAKILGFHMEGPFINPAKKGAHQEELIVPCDTAWTRKLKVNVPGRFIVTVAPETEGALDYIREMRKEGVLIAVGHTDGTYDDIRAAYEAGATHGVHTFNGMRGLHHREPGVVGAIMDLPLIAEVIVDGVHLHPAIVRILSKLKLPDKMVLITDAMRAAGLEDGEYELGGLKVWKKGKEARLADGTLAGSTLTMQEAVQNAVRMVGLSIVDVMQMAATNPARLLGLEDRKGSIEIGKNADLTLLTPDLEVRETIIEGRVVYQKFN